jgi:hypothetical protein
VPAFSQISPIEESSNYEFTNLYGLEVARAFAEDPTTAAFAIDVGAWADEEGHYGSLLGSRSFCGELTEEMDRCGQGAGEDAACGTC